MYLNGALTKSRGEIVVLGRVVHLVERPENAGFWKLRDYGSFQTSFTVDSSMTEIVDEILTEKAEEPCPRLKRSLGPDTKSLRTE